MTAVRFSTSHLVRRRVERRGNRGPDAIPARPFLAAPLPAVRGDRVVLRTPPVLALAPLGDDEPLRFEAVQRGIEGALRNVERVPRDLPDPKEDAIPVQRLQRHRLKDQHVERTREQFCVFPHVGSLLVYRGETRFWAIKFPPGRYYLISRPTYLLIS